MPAVALALALGLAACSSGSSSSTSATQSVAMGASGFDGAALPSGVSAPTFSLRDQAGAPVSLAAYRGRVVVVAFLYST